MSILKVNPRLKFLRFTGFILAIGGFSIMLPFGNEKTINFFGYSSICSFVPISSLVLLFFSFFLILISSESFSEKINKSK